MLSGRFGICSPTPHTQRHQPLPQHPEVPQWQRFSRDVGSKAQKDAERLLDSFWEARGVMDAEQRSRLVKVAAEVPQLGVTSLRSSQPLPGVPATWMLDHIATEAEVLEVSRRLLRLQELLGGSGSSGNGSGSSALPGGPAPPGPPPGVDVTWMVVREPRLLTADYGELVRRLLDMKILASGTGIDVVRVVERQPGLLLSDTWVLELEEQTQQQQQEQQEQQQQQGKSEAVGGLSFAKGSSCRSGGDAGGVQEGRGGVGGMQEEASSSSSRAVGVQKVVAAWEFGLSSDGSAEWEERYRQLEQYRGRYGDPHCGFREGDDLELVRWANKQRADGRRGELTEERRERLQRLGFEFQEDEAEFQRWFAELATFKRSSGHCNPSPLATGVDLYLYHWCAIQRIALRSKVLSSSREQQLSSLGFDWTGADPLS